MSFTDKVVLVTGAASGIGRETAKRFAKQGAALAIVDKDELTAAEAECRDNGAKDVLQVRADFRNQQQVESVVDKVVVKYNRLDILVNNAADCRLGDLLTSSVEDFDLLYTVNVRAMYILTQKAIPHLVASKGNVVNVSSVAGLHPVSGSLLYNMCKAAVDHFTKLVAREFAPKGVRVNSVNPSAVGDTNIARAAGLVGEELQKLGQRAMEAHPLGRVGTTDDIAKAVLFLASDDSSWTTGINFLVDGGRALTMK